MSAPPPPWLVASRGCSSRVQDPAQAACPLPPSPSHEDGGETRTGVGSPLAWQGARCRGAWCRRAGLAVPLPSGQPDAERPLGARQWTVVTCSQRLPATRWDTGGGFNWPRVDQGEASGVCSPQGAVDLPDLHSLAVGLPPPPPGASGRAPLASVGLEWHPAPCSLRAVL